MKHLQVEERQEVNRLEFSVERRWATDFRAQGQVGSEQFWDCHGFTRKLGQGTTVGRKRAGSPLRVGVMIAAQIRVSGRAHSRVLRRDGTAADEVARPVLLGVVGDALPQEAEDDEIAVLAMYAGPPQFDHVRAQRLESIELEFLCAIVTEIRSRITAGLQTVCADDQSRGHVLHDEMVANGIKTIFIQAGEMRLLEALIEFDVEDLVAQGLRGAKFVSAAGET